MTPGQTAVAQSLGSTSYHPEPDATHLVVIGDAASLPTVNAILRAAPTGIPIDVLLERAHDDDALIPLASHAGARVRWVPRAGTASVAEAVDAMAGDESQETQVWVAGETGSLKALRPVLRERFGASKRLTHVQAYWVEGRAMGTARTAVPPR